jgi:hypothetical protein
MNMGSQLINANSAGTKPKMQTNVQNYQQMTTESKNGYKNAPNMMNAGTMNMSSK